MTYKVVDDADLRPSLPDSQPVTVSFKSGRPQRITFQGAPN